MGRRLFGTIRKLPSGRYQARYVDASGRRHQARSTFPSKGDAGRWLSDVEAAIARGTWIDPDAGRVLLADYAQGWIDSRPGLRPRTRELYQSLLDLHLEPTLGDVPLDRLTPALVRRWYVSSIARQDLGRVTLAKCYRLLRAVLNTAVTDGLLARNPCVIKGAGTERSAERPVATLAQVWALRGRGRRSLPCARSDRGVRRPAVRRARRTHPNARRPRQQHDRGDRNARRGARCAAPRPTEVRRRPSDGRDPCVAGP